MSELEELKLAYAECSRQRNELLNKLKFQAQRTWVGMTHEEHMEIMTGTMTTSSRMAAVEAKLREKNQ